ncbi:carbamoyl-phosphate synthase small subunit [Isosphaera pallida ATCC 43644]|uniref:Carbamoyl phosphate synthase small chain n=1 Tax=Isosphaera pallida (strain ATCC 43644 / DSM 9630 / IS1B) TaxID=575540 RepID=E8R613_ISOPI|nr:glutamine-hydrolyzing carbamoyl-phosphate synthase small subunit [Isosphaera pallida]ADV63915.1 carbamoyl-phosphate synthase small subunit [Isosphaera pallida ATCC 43644]
MASRIAKLALEDGTVFVGRGFGAETETDGEVVFNTSMTGYQEIVTDPSYHGQIVTMTYPQIGNYGVNTADAESARPRVRGFVIRELSRCVSNHRAETDLDHYLKTHGIPGLEGIDTRALVRRLRTVGALKGVLSQIDLDDASLVEKARQSPGLVGRDLVREVVPETATVWDESPRVAPTQPWVDVVALDFGMKWNIPRHLTARGCRTTILPGNTPAEAVLERRPAGIFLSNGPGDPEPLEGAIATIRRLIRDAAEADGVPIFGICLGHQLLGLALGGKTYKLKFGHRGANHPVRHEATGRVEITTQNHGFAVDPSSLPEVVRATHFNLNDRTLEGLRHRALPIFAVQYHPEASAGPHDSHYLFDEFRTLIDEAQGRVRSS